MSIQGKPKKPGTNAKRAKKDTTISFIRNNHNVTGIVQDVRDNSVLVKVDIKNMNKLGIESDLTVVNHKNYQIVR